MFIGGPNFGFAEPPGDTVYWQIQNQGDMSIGPLQLAFEGAGGTPAVAYPPFILVAGQDTCSGQTLTGVNTAKSYCSIVIGLDPRLPAGGSYGANFTVRGGNEHASALLSATLRNP